MQKIILFIIITTCLFSCISHQSEPLPIPQETLEQVMFDVHIAEAALAQHPAGTSKDSLADELYEQVAEIHGIDRPTLDTCLAIMQRNPDLAQEVYEKLLERVEKQRLEK